MLRELIARSTAEREPSQLVSLAPKVDLNGKPLVDLATAIILLDYSEGNYKYCKQPKCEEVLTASEAIREFVSCAAHREVSMLGSRKTRKRDRAKLRALKRSKVRSCVCNVCPGD